MSFKILIMSCDKNKDLWDAFHLCMEKYWANHPEIIYCTETLTNPYYKTICVNAPVEMWTKRVRECVKQIDSDYILLTIDDLFLRDYVDSKFVESLTQYVVGNVAALNFEFSFDKDDTPINDIILKRPLQGKFKVSCMCQLWQKQPLLDVFNVDIDPWRFEKYNKHKYYDYLISKNGDFLNWGKPKVGWKWGIVKGKWTHETKDFFDKEGIEIDYNKRGFAD